VRARRLTALLAATHLAIGVLRAAEPRHAGAIAVVVGTKSGVGAVTLDTLREVYLRRRRVWPDGTAVIPVNLPPGTDLRKTFSRLVLGRLPEDLAGYWNRRYFEGIRPPLVLRTPEAVCAYVAVEPDAIGYVGLEHVDRDACRVVLVLPETAD
jgi:hypothetical protein